MVALGVVAASCGGKVEVEVKPGWTEPVNIFLIVVLDPGNRKSAVFASATAPLEEFEDRETRRLAPEIQAAESRLKIAKGQLQRAEHEATTADPEQRRSLAEQAEQLARDVAGMDVPVLPRLLADDTSPERLATLLQEQSGRLAVMSPEGDIIDMMAGRYSAGGMPNFGVFLRGHAGDPIRVDRINRPAEFVKRPALTLCLTIQHDLLRGLIQRPGFRGRGLLGRFLYAIPISLMGRRVVSPPPMPDKVRRRYHDKIRCLLELPARTDESRSPAPYRIGLTPEARQVFEVFEAAIERELGELGNLRHMSDWAGKVVGAVGRVAGLLHMAANTDLASPWRTPIEVTTVRMAIKLGEYLIDHARAAYAEMGGDPDVEAAKQVLRWLQAKNLSVFSLRTLYQGLKGRFKRVDALRPAISVLLEHWFIRERPTELQQGRGRRPSPTYEVNPAALGLQSQNAQNPQNRDGQNVRDDTLRN
jgi:hypothetical protein